VFAGIIEILAALLVHVFRYPRIKSAIGESHECASVIFFNIIDAISMFYPEI